SYIENETTQTPNAGSVTVTLNQSQMTYDLLGTLSGYHAIKTSSDQADVTETVDWTGSSDTAGRLTGFTQTDARQGTGFGATTVTADSGITYDSLNHQSGYVETATSNDASDLVTRTTRTDQTYNGFGQLARFESAVEKTSASGAGLDAVATTKRLSTSYDAAGRTIRNEEQ